MRIAAVSDLHGHLPEIPDCDVLLLGGDYCPMSKPVDQAWWLRDHFTPWLRGIRNRGIEIFGVAGNHDIIFEKRPDLVPPLPWNYLQDSGCYFGGMFLYGSPHQRRFYDWAFNLDEPELAKKWEAIPDDTDILLLHGPPLGLGDFSIHGNERIGSPSLRSRIDEIQPKLVIYGHNHSGFGRYQLGESILLNCSLVNEKYEPVNDVWVIDV